MHCPEQAETERLVVDPKYPDIKTKMKMEYMNQFRTQHMHIYNTYQHCMQYTHPLRLEYILQLFL